MRFYEFEAKRLLAKHGIPVPKGGLAKTPAEAEKLATELGFPVVLKSQVLAGAGAAQAVAVADGAARAKEAATALLQLDDGGRKPVGVLVEKRPQVTTEYALALTYDGTAKRPVLLGSTIAGNIDRLADEQPDKVVRRHFSALTPFSDYLAKELVSALGLKSQELTRMTPIVSRLAQLFLRYDLTQLDVYSVGRLEDGQLVVLDCHADLEVEARPRQKAILEELGIAPEDRRLVREPTPFEIEAAKIDAEDPRGVAGPVVEFDGTIGLVIGAGGGSLTLTDAVRRHGGKPANYAALGGNPSVRKTERLTRLILSKPGVEKIAVMSNVVSNTRADLVARGVIKGVIGAGRKPAETVAIFRVPGAWESEAAKILNKYGVEYCDRSVSMSEAARRAVEKIGR